MSSGSFHEMIVAILAVFGAFTSAWIFYAFVKLLVAFRNSSDFATAVTPTLPLTALAGKVVWITGASSGIGRELALLLASRSAHLILSSRSREGLEEVARECRASGRAGTVSVITLDLSNAHGCLTKKAQEVLKLHGGKIDYLLNNGGVSQRGLTRDSSHEVDQYVCQVDYLAHAELTKAVLPTMERNGGTIVNTNSVAGRIGKPAGSAYSGAKFGLRGFMEALRSECFIMGHPVCILNVSLGSTKTNGPSNWVANIKQGKLEKFKGHDKNIANGLDPKWVAERMMAVAYQAQAHDCWLAPRRELAAMYLSQYFPVTAWRLMIKNFGKEYIVTNEKME